MDRNNAKTYLDVIAAFANGKTIEHKSIGAGCWDIDENPSFAFPHQYRIKPQPKLVPFTFEDNLLFRDRWVVFNKTGSIWRIEGVVRNGVYINGFRYPYVLLFQEYKFDDGSPCGKYVEE